MAAFALRAPSTTLPSARRYSTSISTGVVVVVDDEHGEAVQRLATAGQEPKVAASARVRLLAREAFSSRHPTHPQGVGEGAKVNAASLPQRRARRARPPRLRTDALRSEHAQFSAVIIPALGPRSRLVKSAPLRVFFMRNLIRNQRVRTLTLPSRADLLSRVKCRGSESVPFQLAASRTTIHRLVSHG
jgi:hypothetical protein